MRVAFLIPIFSLLVTLPVIAQKKNDLKRDTTNRKTVTFGGGAKKKEPKEKKTKEQKEKKTLSFDGPVVKEKKDRTPKDTTAKEKGKWKFLFAFDARSSFIRFDGATHNAKLFGLKLGATYKNRHRFGWGVYFLQNNKTPIVVEKGLVPRLDTITNEIVLDTLVHRVNFGYQSLFYEYVFYQKRRWEFSAPLHIGYGVAEVREGIRGQLGDSLIGSVGVPLMGLSVGGHYKVMPWIGVGAGVGYRLMLSGDNNVRRALNAPLFIIKVKLFLGDTYRGVFKRKHGYRMLYRKCDPCKADWSD